MPRFTLTQWLVCIIASIGFAFDTYEILVQPLIVLPALTAMGGLKPGTSEYNNWVSLLGYVPPLVGGALGLIGGYLTDLLGRRRVLTYAIFIYAFSAMAAGFATTKEELLFFRVTTFIGICVEYVAAVAWLAELFQEPKQREAVLGYTQAFASFGGVLVTVANYLCVTYASSLPAIQGQHAAWRYTLISGLIPAIPLIIIRPFLPESPEWQRKKNEGTLKRPSFGEIFQPRWSRATWVSMLLFASAYGAAQGTLQQGPRLTPGLPQTASFTPLEKQQAASSIQGAQEFGGLTGRFVMAAVAVAVVSRRKALRLFQIPGLIIAPAVFFFAPVLPLNVLRAGIFIAGAFTIGQLSLLGNYIPRLYPVHLRGTGESWGVNVGGRMIGAGFVMVTAQLSGLMPGTPSIATAYAAAAVGLFVYLLGFIAAFWMPEPVDGLETD
jgi:MFS family permease